MRHVWLPSLGAWAQVQEPSVPTPTCQTSESRPDSAMAASCSHGEYSSTETRRKKASRHSFPDGGSYGHNSCHRTSCKTPESRQHCHRSVNVHAAHHRTSDQLLHRDEHRHDRSYDRDVHLDHDHDYEPNITCPICLLPISQSSLTVLRWCMHRFCLTCIEKWSCLQRFCPICKQIFHGWYYNIKSTSVFDKKDLTAESSLRRKERYTISRRSTYLSVRRPQRLPLRRNFRLSKRALSSRFEEVLESEADEAALRWRASVYKKNLRAVSSHVNSKVKINQAPVNDPERKARVERRLEPWIRRELQAIMGDTDPSLLVHLVLSLWLHAVSEREKIAESRNTQHQHEKAVHSEIWDSEAIRQLEPFLQEKACMFWHELSCFAESPFSLRTYDCVTIYEKVRG